MKSSPAALTHSQPGRSPKSPLVVEAPPGKGRHSAPTSAPAVHPVLVSNSSETILTDSFTSPVPAGPTVRTRRSSTRRAVRTWVTRARPTLSMALRFTGASVGGYLAAVWVLPGTDPLLAPLTALLVTQLTLSSIVRHGIDRVMSVIAGVSLAVIFSAVVGLSWWSLGVLIGLSIVVGQLLRIGPNLLEVPISAMLVLGVGSTGAAGAAVDRFVETIIGAAVGMVLNIVFPPGVRSKNAGSAVRKYASDMAELLETTAVELTESATKEKASRWLTDARRLTARTADLEDIVDHAEESRKLNIRAIGDPDARAALRGGLHTLEHCSVAVRSIFRGINDVVYFPDKPEIDYYPDAARKLTADALASLAPAIRAFGELVNAQAHESSDEELREMVQAMTSLDEARLMAEQLLRDDIADNGKVHELGAFVAATVGRVERELDLSTHSWIRESTVVPANAATAWLTVLRRLARSRPRR